LLDPLDAGFKSIVVNRNVNAWAFIIEVVEPSFKAGYILLKPIYRISTIVPR
jgi:hypothetical protein